MTQGTPKMAQDGPKRPQDGPRAENCQKPKVFSQFFGPRERGRAQRDAPGCAGALEVGGMRGPSRKTFELVPQAFSTPHTRVQATGAADRFAHSAGPRRGPVGHKGRQGPMVAKMDPEGPQMAQKSLFGGPRWPQKRSPEAPKLAPKESRGLLGAILGPLGPPCGLLGPILGGLGGLLGRFRAVLGRLGPALGRPGAALGPS